MSAFAVDRVCWRVVHDAGFNAAMRENPAAALSEAGLTGEERDALLAGEVGRLYRLGAHPFLLQLLASNGVLDLTPEVYSERMRVVAPLDPIDYPGY